MIDMSDSGSRNRVDVSRMGITLRTKDRLYRGRHRAFEKLSRGSGRATREVRDRPQSLSRKERGILLLVDVRTRVPAGHCCDSLLSNSINFWGGGGGANEISLTKLQRKS